MRSYRFLGAAAMIAVLTTSGTPAAPSDLGATVVVPVPTGEMPQQTTPPPSDSAVKSAASLERGLPALPQQSVAVRPVHIVPENEVLPARPVVIEPPSRQAAAVSAHPHRETRMRARPPLPAVQIAGAAEPTGATALRVGDNPLRLFGIRPPAAGDRCSASALGAAPLPCDEAAGKLLAARLTRYGRVACRLPAPGHAPNAAICLDGDGVDLGGLLVAEGLALADPRQSYDYVGAESVARSNRRGLWLFR